MPVGHPPLSCAPLRTIEFHVHLVGYGSVGSGYYLQQEGYYRKLQSASLLKFCGMPICSL